MDEPHRIHIELSSRTRHFVVVESWYRSPSTTFVALRFERRAINMVSPPDSTNPPTAPAGGAHQDLTPEADSLSTFVPENAPHEHAVSDLPLTPTQARSTAVDEVAPETYIVWPIDD